MKTQIFNSRFRPLAGLFTLLFLAILLSSCASTRIVSSWADSEKTASLGKQQPFVIAVVKNEINRRRIEDEFVKNFQLIGVNATASYKTFPDLKLLSPEVAKEKIPGSGADSVLLVRLVDIKEETVQVPARTEVIGNSFGGSYYNSGFGSYYTRGYTVVTSPAQTFTEKIYRVESSIYDAKSWGLLWSAVTESDESSNANRAIAEFVSVVMKNIRSKMIF